MIKTRACKMCGKQTTGIYDGLPICFEHYQDGTLLDWLLKITRTEDAWKAATEFFDD